MSNFLKEFLHKDRQVSDIEVVFINKYINDKDKSVLKIEGNNEKNVSTILLIIQFLYHTVIYFYHLIINIYKGYLL